MALVLLLLQLLLLAWTGDIALRLAGYRSLLRRVPEFCALLGLAACCLTGYALLLFSNSALIILPAILLLAALAELFLRRRPPSSRPITGPVEIYLRFRATPTGVICWAILATAVAVVLLARYGWLTHRLENGLTAMGTRIYDDMRTIGFPMSLAAFGVPLRNPLAAETLLMYPLGAFILPSGMVALLPSFALDAIIADTLAGAFLFAFVLMLFAARFAASSRALPIVFALSCIFSVAFDWSFLQQTSWFPTLFGYYKQGVNTTVGNTTLIGLVMLGNHVMAFTVYAAIALLYTSLGTPLLAMLAAFAAACSMDLTVFALTAAALWLLATLPSPRALPWRMIGLCLLAAAIMGLIMVPGLTGRMDGLQPRGPSFLRENLFPLGALLSTEGPYFLILAASVLFTANRTRLIPFAAAVISPLIFLLAFHYGSFWFWRGHFALHSLLSMLCAAAIAAIPSAALRTAILALWTAALIPGVLHSWKDIRWFRNASATVTPAQAEAIQWLYRKTKLTDLTVAWKPSEQSLVPSQDYLRAGNRAGKTVYDRTHVVIGYQRNLELMSGLHRGLASNDYVLYERNDPAFERILISCKAPLAFENTAIRIYYIEKNCRAALDAPQPSRPDPSQAGALARKRGEMFWAAKEYKQAVAHLTAVAAEFPDVAEVHYSLGFSNQQLGNHREAIANFTRALDLGYAEFWARYARGASYLALQDKPHAKPDLQRATQLDPTHAGAQTLFRQAAQ